MATWHDDCTNPALWTIFEGDTFLTQDGYFWVSNTGEYYATVTGIRTIGADITGDFELNIQALMDFGEYVGTSASFVLYLAHTEGGTAIEIMGDVRRETISTGVYQHSVYLESQVGDGVTNTLVGYAQDIDTVFDNTIKLTRIGNVYSFYRAGELLGQATITATKINYVIFSLSTGPYLTTPVIEVKDIKLTTGLPTYYLKYANLQATPKIISKQYRFL